MKDITIKSIIAGSLGGLFYQLFVWILSALGIAKVTPFEIGAYMLVKPGVDFTSLTAQMLGAVQHFSNSIFLAFIVAYIVLQTGSDYKLIKGLAIGGILYFALYGVVGRFIVPVAILQPDLATSTAFLVGNLIYGLTVVYIIDQMPQRVPAKGN